LKGQGLWTPQATSKKKDDKLSRLHAAISKLSAQVGAGSNRGGGGPHYYGCGKLGHLSRDYPKGCSLAGSSCTPPKDGEPQTKTVDGTSQLWCSIYRQRTTGSKVHPTARHVHRDQSSSGPVTTDGACEHLGSPSLLARSLHFQLIQSNFDDEDFLPGLSDDGSPLLSYYGANN
jgi:hypothetical protein